MLGDLGLDLDVDRVVGGQIFLVLASICCCRVISSMHL